ncbi:MAG: divergent polysaccharide deacetylase family protein [Methyloceanibacter sp.]
MKALVVASGIVFWSLVLGITWLALSGGSDSGEPVAVLQIEPAPEPAPAPEASETPSDGFDFPPGFAITGPAQPQAPAAPTLPAPGTSMVPPPGEFDAPAIPPGADGSAPSEVGIPPAADAPPSADMPPAADMPPPADMPPATDAPPMPDRRSETPTSEQLASTTPGVAEAQGGPTAQEADTVTLVPAPVAELVEESQYGPLPKVAADGRRPAEVYARPSRHTAKAGSGEPARVAVLLNGLGLPDSPGGDVLKGLPAPISVAYGAYGRDIQDVVTKARAAGHEVLLQIPLEPDDYPNEDPGPHTLLTTLPPEENIKRLQWLMSRYTGYVGVTNHMGAKFESTKDSFLPVLEELKRRGLIYFDDGTVQSSTAAQLAGLLGLDYSAANVQIDAKPGTADIAKALAELETMARERGAAIGVVKAKPETVKQLVDWAGKLEAKGIVLVPVSAAVRSQRQS